MSTLTIILTSLIGATALTMSGVFLIQSRRKSKQIERMTAKIDAEDIQDIVIDGWLTMDKRCEELKFWRNKPFRCMGEWSHLPMEISPDVLPMMLDPGIRYSSSPQKFRLSLTRNKE